MKRRLLALAGISILAALSLGSPVPAGQEAKRRILIDSRVQGIGGGTGRFIFSLGTGGDFGKLTFMRSFGANRKTPEGLAYALVKETDSMKGKSGTLVIRSIGPGYDMGIGPNEVWMGRWSIVRGTGDYSGLTGGGRWVLGLTSMNRSRLDLRGL